ncbi:hypothetical protein J2X36_004273 [Methylobacterium sp. BE186]|uniref:hypothetical protein n=1 Tax=Methylobacterium sp. BE186 TaxID=2817715 RepID=UPI002858325F|nr:hypothetical protein [Methylobacterium sp. BE186]MDR7039497.1 hypothetical protein [Methylobacterium sp. BE186]
MRRHEWSARLEAPMDSADRVLPCRRVEEVQRQQAGRRIVAFDEGHPVHERIKRSLGLTEHLPRRIDADERNTSSEPLLNE